MLPQYTIVCSHCGVPFIVDSWKRTRLFCSSVCYHLHSKQAIDVRFWAKVKKTATCWLWTGAESNGYGRLNRGDHSTYVYAHRFSWTLHNGPIPDGFDVLHACDQSYPVGDISYRRCVRPSHLFLGTNTDNIADRIAKGRSPHGAQTGPALHPECMPRGIAHYRAKLDDLKVAAIRQKYDAGRTITVLAREYDVVPATVRSIIHRKTWTHVI